MLHITVGMLVVLLGVTAFFALGIGAQAERREAEKKQRKLEAQRRREQAKVERQEMWRKRKEAVVEKLMPWRRGRQGD